MNSKIWLSRRNVLRGLGVGLSLPWLESLAVSPASAQAAAASPIKRYLLMYFPCGVADFWTPKGEGAAGAWTMNALHEPLLAHKKYIQVVSNVGQFELYNSGVNPNPSHSLYCSPSFSCTNPDRSKKPILGGPTTDQIIAGKLAADELAAGIKPSPFKSLQTGCSTMNSNPDGLHTSITRSVSWSSSEVPLYKEVNPQSVFDTLVTQLAVGGSTDPVNQALAQRRKDRNLSVLDYVLDEANSLNPKLSKSDRARLDRFLTSVREIEGQVKSQGATMPGVVKDYTRPSFSASYNERRPGTEITDAMGYNRNTHAEVMNDLITMAFESNLTRVITHMLDDARSEYHYNFLKERTFTKGSSTSIVTNGELAKGSGDVLGYHGLSHSGANNNGFATVNRWFVEKLASLLDRLTLSPEAEGKSVLDNTFILFMSGMKGSGHELVQLPVLFAGGGAVFKNDYHNAFPAFNKSTGQIKAGDQVKLADVHLTIMQKGFGMNVDKIGYSTGIVPELLR